MTKTTHPPQQRSKRSIIAKDIIFDHACVQPTHCLANGLFCPIKHGQRAATALDITHPYKTYAFRWQHSTESLCNKDQRVFLAVLYLASVPGRTLCVGTDYTRRDTLKQALNELNEKTVWGCKYDQGSQTAFIQRTQLGQQAAEGKSARAFTAVSFCMPQLRHPLFMLASGPLANLLRQHRLWSANHPRWLEIA